jgi:hypothetical protein
MKNIVQSNTNVVTNNLIVQALNQANSRGDSKNTLAELVGMTYVYFMALARGERPVDQMNRKYFVGFANYLQIPIAQAYLLGGALLPSDFLVKETAPALMGNVFTRMRSDSQWGGFVPTNAALSELDNDTKHLICLLYERLVGTSSINSVYVHEDDFE